MVFYQDSHASLLVYLEALEVLQLLRICCQKSASIIHMLFHKTSGSSETPPHPYLIRGELQGGAPELSDNQEGSCHVTRSVFRRGCGPRFPEDAWAGVCNVSILSMEGRGNEGKKLKG